MDSTSHPHTDSNITSVPLQKDVSIDQTAYTPVSHSGSLEDGEFLASDRTTYRPLSNSSWYWAHETSIVIKVWSPVLLLLGTVGNALAIVIMRKMSSGSSVFPTLFIALAVADLGTLYLGLLPEWLGVQFGFWVMNSSEGVCKVLFWGAYSIEMLSSWLLVTMTVQRAFSVVWPLHARSTCSRRQGHVTIAILTAVSFLLNSSSLFERTLVDNNGERVCEWSENFTKNVGPIFGWFNLPLYSALPSLIMIVSNCLVIRKIVSSARQTGSESEPRFRSQSQTDSYPRITVILIVVSFVFISLTFPLFLMQIVAQGSARIKESSAFRFWYTCAYMMWFSNSAVNFFLYVLTGSKFRDELRSLFARQISRKRGTVSNDTVKTQEMYV